MILFNWKATKIPAGTETATEWSAIFSNCQILLEVIHAVTTTLYEEL